MDQKEAIDLIQEGIGLSSVPQIWADLGCGDGTFTKAIASRLSINSIIYAIDKNKKNLESVPDNLGSVKIQKANIDFYKEVLPIDHFDGILMANSLHYIVEKTSFLLNLSKYLESKGSLIIVEYETKHSNPWVPYPIGRLELFDTLNEAGCNDIKDLGNMNSRYGHLIYSVGCSFKNGEERL